MNKIKSKNGDIQQNKKKTCKPENKRKKRNSGINYVVNVSSSGTNLHKKIQDEMTKLENVERKIRNGKTRVKEICTSRGSTEKSSNDHKLKQIFEEMLDDFAPVKKLPKKRSHKAKEPEIINLKPKRQEKGKKYVQTNIKVVSLTDLNLKDKLTPQKNRDTIKITSPLKKSALKKPKTAPTNKRHDSLVKDLKFAECLNFRKDINLHLSISDMKQFVVSSFTKNNEIEGERLNLKNSLEEKYNREIYPDKMFQEYAKSNKPDRKRFYSSLTRGNFTISEHGDNKILHKDAVKDPRYLEPITGIEAMNKQENISNDSSGGKKDSHENSLEVELKESFVAVENENSTTRNFPSITNLKEKTSHNLKSRSQIKRSASILDFQNSMKEIVVLKTPIQSFLASEETMKYQKWSYHKYFQHFEEDTDFKCDIDKNLDFSNIATSIKKETFSFSCSKVELNLSQKLLKNSEILIDDLAKTSNLKGFKTKLSTSSNESVDEDRKKMESNFNLTEIFSQYFQNSDVKTSGIFPEYNIEKCLSLLRKKFWDFESTRHKNLDKNSSEKKVQQRDSFDRDAIHKSSQQLDYEVCFKNENFVQSEISLDSFNKIDEEMLSFKSLMSTEYLANSNP